MPQPLELERTHAFIGSLNAAWPNAAEFERGYELLRSLRLSTGLGIPDCLIAAMALSRDAKLYTFNLKHFQAVPGLDVEPPYER